MIKQSFLKLVRRERGIGILEVIIASALLLIVVFGISQFITSSKTLTVKLEDSTQCQSFAKSVIEKVASFGVRDNVLPAFASGAGQEATFYAGDQLNKFTSHFPTAAQNVFWGTMGSTSMGRVVDTNGNVSNAHLILGAVTYLETVYNSNPAQACAGFALPPELMDIDIQGGGSATISITPSRIDNQALVGACTQTFRSGPKGSNVAANHYAAYQPNTSIQYKLRVDVAVNTPSGDTLNCSQEQTFSHQYDGVNDGTVASITASAVAGTWETASNPPTLCDGQDVEFTVQINNMEAGSVPLCRADYMGPGAAVTGNWGPCSTVQFPGQTGATTLTAVSGTSFRVRFQGLPPQSRYAFNAGSVDTAGNLATTAASYQFLVDTVRPGIASIQPVGNVTYGAAPYAGFPYQCNGLSSDFEATYDGSDPLTLNWTSCEASTNPNVATLVTGFDGTKCQIRVGGGFAAGNNRYTTTVVAKDVCPSDGGSLPFSWWVLMQAIQVRWTGTNPTGLQYTNTLTADAPAGLARAECDGSWVGGSATPTESTATWQCNLNADHGTCRNGLVSSYNVEDTCGRTNQINGAPWIATNGCYPERTASCATRIAASDPTPPLPTDKCPGSGATTWIPSLGESGFYSQDSSCAASCSLADGYPTKCEGWGGCSDCFYCRSVCEGAVPGPYYKPGAPTPCSGACLDHQRCVPVPPNPAPAPAPEGDCKYCENTCSPGQFVNPKDAGGPACSGEACCDGSCPGTKYCVSAGGDCHRCRDKCEATYPATGFYEVEQCSSCNSGMTCSPVAGKECSLCACPGTSNAIACGPGTNGKCEQLSGNASCYKHCEPNYLNQYDLPPCGDGADPAQDGEGCWYCAPKSCPSGLNPCPCGAGGDCQQFYEYPAGSGNYLCEDCVPADPPDDPPPDGTCPEFMSLDTVSPCTFDESPPYGSCNDDGDPCTVGSCTGVINCETRKSFASCDRDADTGNMPWQWRENRRCVTP